MCGENSFEKVHDFLETASGASDLIEVLHKVQDYYGYIPKEAMQMISKELGVPVSKIYGVATFYSRFSLYPRGKYVISVCMGTACYVKGAEAVMKEFEEVLGIKKGETTEDLIFSIVETRCLGECAQAPVVMVNDKVYCRVTPQDVNKILSEIEGGQADE